MTAHKMPKQKPRRSVQEVGTPREFLDAVERRFGKIQIDLAANADNAVVADYCPPKVNALAISWCEELGMHAGRLGWLNPPFSDIGPWARRCAEESAAGARILFLVPASVGSNWFNRWVRPFAYVLELTPRLKFVSHAASYPKDLVLCVYGPDRLVGRDTWRWTSDFDGMAAGDDLSARTRAA